MAMILWTLLGFCHAAQGIEIEFTKVALPGKEALLLCAFVSFEKGELDSASRAVLCDSGGRSVPADFIPTLHWEDSSVRTVAIRASVAAHRARGRFRLFPKGRRGLKAMSGIEVSRRGRSVTVDTGCLLLTLDGDSPRFISSGTMDRRDVAGLDEGLDLKVPINGTILRPADVRLRVTAGSAVAEAVFTGILAGQDPADCPSFRLSMRFLAGSGRLCCRLSIQGGAMAGSCGGAFLSLMPPWERSGSTVVCHLGGLSEVHALMPGGRLCLRATPSSVVVVDGEETVEQSKKGHLRVEARGCRPGIVLDLPRFGRLHPWSLSVCQGGPLCLSLLNDRFDWEPFFTFQREFFITFRKGYAFARSAASSTERAFFGMPSDRRRRSVLFVPVEEADCESRLVTLYWEVTGLLIERLRSEWRTWDGFMNYGDYRKSYGIWANQEFDPAHGLLRRFLWTGNPRDLSMAESIVAHWLSYDRAGKDDPAARPGTPWMHGRAHRSGLKEPGHAWLDGPLLLYTLTGEPEHLEAALQVGDFLARSLPGLKKTVLERNLSWSLYGLSALVEAGHDRYSGAMEQAACMLRSRQVKGGLFGFRESLHDEKSCFESNTWVTSGITVEALLRHFAVTGDTRSRDAALGAMRIIVEKGCDHETGRFSERLFFGTIDGDVLGRSGRVKGGRLALLATGMARLYLVTGDEQLRQRAASLLRRALVELRSDVPAYPGEDLAMLLRIGIELVQAVAVPE